MAELVGSELERKRGDTAPDVLLVLNPEDPTLPLDVTGFSYKLTINSLKSPPDDTTQLLQVNGTVVNGPLGRVEFAWTAPQADQVPGKYWYDIQQTDGAGRIKTIAKNRYIVYQDITKA
jgi:hypothetical protein